MMMIDLGKKILGVHVVSIIVVALARVTFCDIPVWLVFLFTDEIPLLSKMKQSRPISF